MILFYYLLSIILCKYTNSPILGIFACLVLSIFLWMTVMECIGAFAGAVCAYQIKTSDKFWRITLINGIGYLVLIGIFGGGLDLRLLYTFGLAWSMLLFKYFGYV